jgi:membrane fusion protein (multidrug efflux system)
VAKRLIFLLAALVLAVAAYLAVSAYRKSAQPVRTAAPPSPEVGIVTVAPTEVPFPVEHAARVVGFRDVEVRSLVGGILLKRGFEEGARVAKGQALFQIDPAPYQVALQRAEAQLAQAQAVLRQAEDNFERVEELFRRGVSTEKQQDESRAARGQARATAQLAQADIASAKLNLGHTEINAPVAGLTALQSPSIGTLIQAQQTLLTTIAPVDPAYVSFSFTDEEGQAFRTLNAPNFAAAPS